MAGQPRDLARASAPPPAVLLLRRSIPTRTRCSCTGLECALQRHPRAGLRHRRIAPALLAGNTLCRGTGRRSHRRRPHDLTKSGQRHGGRRLRSAQRHARTHKASLVF